jgi:hypothetical protein
VGDVVPDRVLEQVRHEADEQPPIAQDQRRGERDVEVQVLGDRIALVRAQRVARHHGQVYRLAVAEPLLPLSQREQRVDQLLLLLVFLERVAARFPEFVGGGGGVGDHHLEQRAGGGQRRAQLVRGVGHEASLRVIRPFERTQHPPRHHPAQASRDQRHDGQRDRRLDLEVVQIGAPLAVAHELDGGLAARRLQDPLDVGRQLRPRCRRVDLLPRHVRRAAGPSCLALDGELRTGFQAQRRVRHEPVSDRQKRGAAGEEQTAVEQGEPPPDGRLGSTQAVQPAHRPFPIR